MFVIGVYEPRGATPEPATRTVDRQFDRSFSNQPHFGVHMVVCGVRRSARRQRRQLCGFRHMHAERSCHGGNQLRGHDREPTIFHDQISVGFKVGQAREPTISLCDKQRVTFNQGRTPSTLRGYPHDQDVGCRWDVIQSMAYRTVCTISSSQNLHHRIGKRSKNPRSRYVPVRRNFAVFCVFGVSKNQ